MLKVCQGPGCEIEYEAKRAFSKYHAPACRKRAQIWRDQGRELPGPKPEPACRTLAKVPSFLEQTTREELDKSGRVMSSHGQMALILARRIEGGGAETGAALASMIRECAAAMERAMKEGPAADPVRAAQDEVARRRASRSTAG